MLNFKKTAKMIKAVQKINRLADSGKFGKKDSVKYVSLKMWII